MKAIKKIEKSLILIIILIVMTLLTSCTTYRRSYDILDLISVDINDKGIECLNDTNLRAIISLWELKNK